MPAARAHSLQHGLTPGKLSSHAVAEESSKVARNAVDSRGSSTAVILSKAPLRLSFFGGGSDFPEIFRHQRGAVLSTAIDAASHVTAVPLPAGLFEQPIRLSHEEIERCSKTSEIQHPLFRAAFEQRQLEGPIELHSRGDLPSGSGLGSSSSFCVALLHALDALDDRRRDAMELAYEAIELERRVAKDAVGCQDQVMAALGGLRRTEFHALDDIRSEALPMSPERLRELEASLALIYVGGRRSAPKIERRKLDRVEANRRTLHDMVAQVDRASDLLCGDGPLERFGQLLDEAWQAKRSLAPGVSTPEIDALYDNCKRSGAVGAKLLGAGGGGFLLVFAPPESLGRVIERAARPALRPRLAQPGVGLLSAAPQ